MNLTLRFPSPTSEFQFLLAGLNTDSAALVLGAIQVEGEREWESGMTSKGRYSLLFG